MSVSIEQLDEFHRFAANRLEAGAQDLSLEDLLRMWRIESDRSETVEAVQQGIADMDAGRCYTIEEVDDEIQRRFEQMRPSVSEDST